jgi:SCP-2 sterol transfer family
MGLRSPLDRPLARLFFVLAEERGIREEVESVLLDGSDGRGIDDAARAQQPGKIKSALRRRGLKQLSKMVADAGDAEIEERFQSRPVQRALFTAAAMTFVPEKAYGFQGTIGYELTSGPDPSGCVREPDHWTVTIAGDKATARRGKASAPAVLVRIGLADFVRVAAGLLNPVKAMLAGRIEVEGDVTVAGRLVEMFGETTE